MKTLLSAMIGALLAFAVAEARADGGPQERQVSFAIESRTLADALDQWAQQTGFQILVPNWELAKKINAPKLKGKLSARAALEKLLDGTPFGYSWVGDRAVSIKEKSSVPPTALPQRRLRVAQLDDDPSQRLQAAGSGARRTGVRDRVADELERDAVEEILVTGSRLSVRGEGVSPVTIFGRKKLSTLGVATVGDVMRYVPQQPYTQAAFSQPDGAVFAEMRGLGVDTTLVLINGRRAVPSAATANRNAFDLNSIPLPAIDRIEVLSDSASAIYGADAVGGVVNIILKREVAQPTVELSYGAADGGADERRAALTAGISGESLKASLILDYFDRGALLGEDRERLRNQDFRRFGAADRTEIEADPGNVSSLTGQNLPGLTAPIAAVPVGSLGVMSVDDFAATAGTQNRESLDRYRAIVPEAKRLSAGVFLELSLPLEGAAAFGEFLYADRETTKQVFPPVPFGFVVPAENPYNPFGEAVFVNRLLTELGPQRTETDSQMYRALLGLRLPMGAWDFELSALLSKEDSTSVLSNRLDFAALDAAAFATDPALAINPFQDGPLASEQVLSALEAAPSRNEYASDGYQGSAIVRGDLFELAAGSVALAAGVEWRKEDILFDDFILVEHDRTVAASFAELRVPIIGRDQAIPWFQDVWASVAVRYDDYSDFGGTVNPQVGLAWRTTALRSVRPPCTSCLRRKFRCQDLRSIHGVATRSHFRPSWSAVTLT
jgi:iron complex outermembrane recepter protein